MSTNDTKIIRRRLQRTEVFKIYDLLKKVGQKKEGNLYVYNEGWSDIAVANKIDPTISHWSIKDIRQESFGHLVRAPDQTGRASGLSKKIEDLENIVKNLSERLTTNERGLDHCRDMIGIRMIRSGAENKADFE